MISIRPSRDIRTNYSEISKLCKINPVAITVNGREDTVIMSHESYNATQEQILSMQEQLKLYAELAQAEDDYKLGRVYSEENFFNNIIAEVKG